jgi:integrase
MSFLRWCAEDGYPVPDTEPIARLRRRYPKTYGKVQDRNPARFLDHDAAFGALVAVCQNDPTPLGLRDELILRLGLSGMRASEIAALRVGDLQLNASPPLITWTGKGRKARHSLAAAPCSASPVPRPLRRSDRPSADR